MLPALLLPSYLTLQAQQKQKSLSQAGTFEAPWHLSSASVALVPLGAACQPWTVRPKASAIVPKPGPGARPARGATLHPEGVAVSCPNSPE